MLNSQITAPSPYNPFDFLPLLGIFAVVGLIVGVPLPPPSRLAPRRAKPRAVTDFARRNLVRELPAIV